jgi:hypothetical protein
MTVTLYDNFTITTYRHSGKIAFVPDPPHCDYGGYHTLDGYEIHLSPPEARGGYESFSGAWYCVLDRTHDLIDDDRLEENLPAAGFSLVELSGIDDGTDDNELDEDRRPIPTGPFLTEDAALAYAKQWVDQFIKTFGNVLRQPRELGGIA